MPVNEVFRRVLLGRWYALLLPVLLCVGGVVAVEVVRAQPAYEATARIQASATPPSSTVEADSVLNRVTGVATSRDVVLGAMQDAAVTGRSPADVARKAITVTRIGSSAVFDLSVQDRDPRVARALTKAVAQRVVGFLTGPGGGSVVFLTNDLQSKLDAARTKRAEKNHELALAQTPGEKANLESVVAALDQEIASISATIGNVETARATASSATVVSDSGPAKPVPRHLATDIALAACLGLTLGLLLAALLELLSPRAADGEAVAERLGAPLLGTLRGPSHLRKGDAMSSTTLLALRRALARSGAKTLVVTGSCTDRQLEDLQRKLAGTLGEGARNPWAATVPSASRTSPSTQAGLLNGLGDGPTTAVRTREEEEAPTDASTLRVVGLEEADEDTTDAVLVYVARPLTPYRELADLKNLAAATGWPVLGVLEVGTRPTGGPRR
jgi:capsular polysaccharide biosynthesis protein